jgi:Mg-chelatase subunit ChlD
MQDGGSRQESDGLREGGDTENPRAEMTENGSCQAQFEELIAEHGEDYSECLNDVGGLDSCKRPEFLSEDGNTEQINVQVILDSSGSMAGLVDGKQKLDIAKEALTDFLATLPEQARVSLRVYGHKGSNAEADKAVSCAGSEVLYDFQQHNPEMFSRTINTFQPTGWTPIATSLEEAEEDFSSYSSEEQTNIIYLVSDGIETCDGDPVAAAQEINSSNIQAIVNVIGFDVDAQAKAQLQTVAQAGGGQYIEARSAEELAKAFELTVDWDEWNAYRSCILDERDEVLDENFDQRDADIACIVEKRDTEIRTIYSEMTKNDTKYGGCLEYIIEKIKERAEEKNEAAYQEGATAESVYDETVEETRDRFEEGEEYLREEKEKYNQENR